MIEEKIMMLSDRFLLEQQILDCWRITSDLRTIAQHHLEGPGLTKDEIVNLLTGIESLYEIKFDQTFRTFEKMIQEQQIK